MSIEQHKATSVNLAPKHAGGDRDREVLTRNNQSFHGTMGRLVGTSATSPEKPHSSTSSEPSRPKRTVAPVVVHTTKPSSNPSGKNENTPIPKYKITKGSGTSRKDAKPSTTAKKFLQSCQPCRENHDQCDKQWPSCGRCLARQERWDRAGRNEKCPCVYWGTTKEARARETKKNRR